MRLPLVVRWLALLACGLSGCAPVRVNLVAPAPDASAEERERAWEQLRPAEAEVTRWQFARRPRVVAKQVAVDVESMTLANGVVVEDPRDFLPVVAADSATAKEARAWVLARHRWDVFSAILLSGLGAGLSVMLSGPPIARGLGAGPDVGYALMVGGVANAVIVPVVALVIPAIFVRSPDVHRYAAFANYEADLLRFLQP